MNAFQLRNVHKACFYSFISFPLSVYRQHVINLHMLSEVESTFTGILYLSKILSDLLL